MKRISLIILSLLLQFSLQIPSNPSERKIHGRYTRDISDYELTIPRKLTNSGSFQTFDLPHFFSHNFTNRKRKRSLDDPHLVHYGVVFNGAKHHLQLWPNHDFLSPNAVFEKRQPRAAVSERKLKMLGENQLCHFTGRVKGEKDSRVAVATCDGLAGYIMLNGETYFIEPIADHVPNKRQQHMHLIYKKRDFGSSESVQQCGTNEKWTDAWERSLRRKYREDGYLKEHEDVPRGSKSVHRYLETLVVCDKKFVQHHKHTDYETYVLTVMNMVSDFYHDSSSGNQLDVVVVRIIYLEKEEEEIDLTINPNADETLASFCKWQQAINPKDITSPNHHDIAVLLTRHDICADQGANCGLMGLAYVATPCTGDQPCAINEDGGLILAIIVAHEMGHVMGCSHDKEEDSGCKSQDENDFYYVMAPYVHMATSKWSACSKTYITELFNNDLGECLNDEPQSTLYPFKNMLPGAVYDANQQCNIDYPNSTICPRDPNDFCKELVCKVDAENCMSNGEPPADGTKCGENHWCYMKKCIEMGQRLEAVNGGWGEWSPWSDCTRTCGGGVSISQRDCDNPQPQNKGRYCLGERKKVKICNMEPCPEGGKSFRAVQCAEFDPKPFNDKLYHWEPFFKDDDPCTLYCLNTDNVFVKLAPRAKDGTPCKRGTKNICVSGVCRKVGCDSVLDSKAVEDICGICKGDGTQCKIIEDTYMANPGHGYVKVVTIPKGSRNILFDELKPSDNTLAVTAPDEQTFYLNGANTEQQDGTYIMGGAEGVYNHPEPNKESLFIHGPLKEDIVLFVMYYAPENVGYHYKYSEPSAESSYQPQYHWEFLEWSDCSARCGGGVEVTEPECVEEKAGKVTASFCERIEKPQSEKRKCNEQPCKTKWRVGKWGKCTACEHQSGLRMREVECVREAPVPGEEDVLVDDNECTEKKPGNTELCNSQTYCSSYHRRDVDNLSPSMMQDIFSQTLPEVTTACYSNEGDSESCASASSTPPHNDSKTQTKNKPEVGSIVKDMVSPEEIRLKVVPLQKLHQSLNLSDEAFETAGDKIPDTLDMTKSKNMTGKSALDAIKNFSSAQNSTD